MSMALADLSDWDSLMSGDLGGAPEPAAVEVRTIFRGVPLDTRILAQRQQGRRRRGWRSSFTIGSDAGVDAPVAAGVVPWSSHPLVMAAGSGYVVNVTPQMKGKVRVQGRVRALAAFVRENGNTFTLPASAAVQVDCGATSFILGRTSAPRRLPRTPWRWSWSRHAPPLGALLTVGLMSLTMLFLPGDPRALSFDLFGREPHLLPTVVKPPLVIEVPLPQLPGAGPAGAQSVATGSAPAGRKSRATEGAMGDPAAPARSTRTAIAGGPTPVRQPSVSKTQAIAAIQNAGVLGVLKATTGSHVASIFGADRALGPDAANVLGTMVGTQLAGAFGRDGLGMVGTGAAQAGTGDQLIGTNSGLDTGGPWGDRMRGGGGGDRTGGVGDLVGRLPPKRRFAVQWIQNETHVRGALDKEIVRRVIRLHLNEIKYCYEQELVRVPSLSGRIVVQFTIAPLGQVIVSYLQGSTLANARVENCAVQAVRRWQFPKPDGGGLVTVSYPFVLAPSGG